MEREIHSHTIEMVKLIWLSDINDLCIHHQSEVKWNAIQQRKNGKEKKKSMNSFQVFKLLGLKWKPQLLKHKNSI